MQLVLLFLVAIGTAFPQTWTELPKTTLRSNSSNTICPENNFQPPGGGMPAYNFSDFCGGVVNSWNSAVVDTKRNRLLMMGGGHANYHGNETYALDLTAKSNTAACTGGHPCETNSGVPALRRLNDPAVFTLYGGSSCYDPPFPKFPTEYAGPSPVTVHTFGAEVYLPKSDKVFAFWGGPDFADCIQYFHVWLLNLSALDAGSRTPWEKHTPSGFNVAGTAPGSAPAFAFCVLDPVTEHESVDCLWGAHGWMLRYDVEADSWAQLSPWNAWTLDGANAPSAVVDPDRKLVYFIGPNYQNTPGSGRIFAWDPKSPAKITNLTPRASGCGDLIGFPNPALAWDPMLHRVVGFVPSRSTVDIRKPDPQVIVFDPETLTCSAVAQKGTPPPADPTSLLDSAADQAANHGIFGHFAYVPALNEYVWYANPASNAYTFKLTPDAPRPPMRPGVGPHRKGN